MNHEVARKRVVLAVGNHGRGDCTGDVAALLEDVVYLEAERSLVSTEERLREGGVPKHLVLFVSVGVARVGAPGNIALEAYIPGEV